MKNHSLPQTDLILEAINMPTPLPQQDVVGLLQILRGPETKTLTALRVLSGKRDYASIRTLLHEIDSENAALQSELQLQVSLLQEQSQRHAAMREKEAESINVKNDARAASIGSSTSVQSQTDPIGADPDLVIAARDATIYALEARLLALEEEAMQRSAGDPNDAENDSEANALQLEACTPARSGDPGRAEGGDDTRGLEKKIENDGVMSHEEMQLMQEDVGRLQGNVKSLQDLSDALQEKIRKLEVERDIDQARIEENAYANARLFVPSKDLEAAREETRQVNKRLKVCLAPGVVLELWRGNVMTFCAMLHRL